MSRIGKQSIVKSADTSFVITDGGKFGHKTVTVSGKHGELALDVRHGIEFVVEDNTILVNRNNDTKQVRSFHGLYRSLINNMVNGVENMYSKELEIVGIGYRAEMQGNVAVFSLGYSHKINYNPPVGIVIEITEQTKVKVSGIDKQLVGEVASKIRAFRKPEPYKGKGVKYSTEIIKRKSAKSAGK